MRLGIAIALAAGCGPSSAIEIEVHAPANVPITDVRLYIGVGEPTSEAIAPAGYGYQTLFQPGEAWTRLAGNERDHAAVDETQQVTFTFTPGPGPDHFGIVAAVGLRDGMIVAGELRRDIALVSGQISRYIIELAPAPQVQPAGNLTAFTLQPWGPADDGRCLYVVDRRAAGIKPIFIVDDGDKDCDDVPDDRGPPAGECRPLHVYKQLVRPPRAALRCLTRDDEPNAPVPGQCMLGGPGCRDGQGEVPSRCDPGQTCAPDAVCTTCGNDLQCAATKAEVLPHLDCVVFGVPDVAGTTQLNLCPDKVDLRGTLRGTTFETLTLNCVGGFRFLTPPNTMFDTSITLTGDSTAATFVPVPSLNPCEFTLSPMGFAQAGAHTSLVDVQFGNGRGVAMPLVLNVRAVSQCPTTQAATDCKFTGLASDLGQLDDTLLKCASTAVPDAPTASPFPSPGPGPSQGPSPGP